MFLLIKNEAFRRPFSIIACAILSLLGSFLINTGFGIITQTEDMARNILGGKKGELELKVYPPKAGLIGLTGFVRPVLSPKNISDLRNMKEIKSVSVLNSIPLPTTIIVSVPGILSTSQFLSLSSISKTDIKEELREEWEIKEGFVIPIVMSDQVINLYNLSMADRYDLPRLTKEIFQAGTFELLIGRDRFKSLPNNFRVHVVVVGFSNMVSPWGIAIPKKVAENWLSKFPEAKASSAIQATIKFTSAENQEKATENIEKLGLRIENENNLSSTVTKLSRAGKWIVSGLLLFLLSTLIIAIVSLTTAIIGERKRQFAIYRLFGGSTKQLFIVFCSGIVGMIVLGSMIGALLSYAFTPFIMKPMLELFTLQNNSLTNMPLLSMVLYSFSISFSITSLFCIITIFAQKKKKLLELLGDN